MNIDVKTPYSNVLISKNTVTKHYTESFDNAFREMFIYKFILGKHRNVMQPTKYNCIPGRGGHVRETFDMSLVMDREPYTLEDLIEVAGFDDEPRQGALASEYAKFYDVNTRGELPGDRNLYLLDIAVAAAICGEIIDALAHIQACGLIHGDLKPKNILITREMHAKVIDFNLSQFSALPIRPQLLQTITYRAPEINYTGDNSTVVQSACGAGAISDIWAFGMILFEVLAGEALFPMRARGEDHCEWMLMHFIRAGLIPSRVVLRDAAECVYTTVIKIYSRKVLRQSPNSNTSSPSTRKHKKKHRKTHSKVVRVSNNQVGIGAKLVIKIRIFRLLSYKIVNTFCKTIMADYIKQRCAECNLDVMTEFFQKILAVDAVARANINTICREYPYYMNTLMIDRGHTSPNFVLNIQCALIPKHSILIFPIDWIFDRDYKLDTGGIVCLKYTQMIFYKYVMATYGDEPGTLNVIKTLCRDDGSAVLDNQCLWMKIKKAASIAWFLAAICIDYDFTILEIFKMDNPRHLIRFMHKMFITIINA